MTKRITKADWEQYRDTHHLARIEQLAQPGDVIAADLVHYLVKMTGPGSLNPLQDEYMQLGDPYDFQIDDQGKPAPRFFTMTRFEDTWRYQGQCHDGALSEPTNVISYERMPLQAFREIEGNGYGDPEYVQLTIDPNEEPGYLSVGMQRLARETGLMESYTDVTSTFQPMPFLQTTIDPDETKEGMVEWLQENHFGQVIAAIEDEYGFEHQVFAFDEEKLKAIDPLCFSAYREEAQVKSYHFTFGSSAHFPYQGGCVEVQAQGRKEAIRLFRSHYPDRLEGIVNCAFIYDQNEWGKTTALRDADHDCHRIITELGPYEVAFIPENEQKSLQHLMAEAKENASDKNKQHAEQQQDLQARQTKTPPSQER